MAAMTMSFLSYGVTEREVAVTREGPGENKNQNANNPREKILKDGGTTPAPQN